LGVTRSLANNEERKRARRVGTEGITFALHYEGGRVYPRSILEGEGGRPNEVGKGHILPSSRNRKGSRSLQRGQHES